MPKGVPEFDRDPVLRFGKYSGKCISAVPTEYLDWLLGGESRDTELMQAILAELKTRRDWHDIGDDVDRWEAE